MKKKLFALLLLICGGLFAASIAFAAPTSSPQCPAPSTLQNATYMQSIDNGKAQLFLGPHQNLLVVSGTSKQAAKKLLKQVKGSYSIKRVAKGHSVLGFYHKGGYYYCNYAPFANPTYPIGANAQKFVTFLFIRSPAK